MSTIHLVIRRRGGGRVGAGRTNLRCRKSGAALNYQAAIAGAGRVTSDGDSDAKEGEGGGNPSKARQSNLFAGLNEDVDEEACQGSNKDEVSFHENGSNVEAGDGDGPDR